MMCALVLAQCVKEEYYLIIGVQAESCARRASLVLNWLETTQIYPVLEDFNPVVLNRVVFQYVAAHVI